MEDKIIISIESNGFKHTTEASNQIDSYEFSEIVFNLMCATGYHKDSIIEGFTKQNLNNKNNEKDKIWIQTYST